MTELQEPSSTRELIITEALHHFAGAGYSGTSLNEIAAAVGIRRPSLLYHFPSKDALYGEVFERILSDWFERVETSVTTASVEGWDKIELVLRAGFALFQENDDYVRLMRREALDGGGHLAIDLSAVLRPLFERAVSYFRQEMDAGRLRRHDPVHLVITGYGILLTYFSDAPFIRGLMDVDPLGPEGIAARRDHVVAFFRSALQPEGR